MNGDKFLISYDWRNPVCNYTFCKHWTGNSLILFLLKFIIISFKYEVVDVQYRNYKDAK